MKFSENSLVVDVIKISNSSYKLSVPAGDLLTAAMNGAVLRRHDLSTASVPNVLYVPLSEAKLQSGTYTFTFASGDAFTASSADAYPEAESVSDETGGGTGGGVLVVTLAEGALNKTWQEIHDAFPNVYIAEDGTMNTILMIYEDGGEYGVVMADGPTTATFVATSASGYPAAQ